MDLDGLSGLHENSVLIFAARDILGKHGSRHNNLVKEFLLRGPILPHYVQHFEAIEQSTITWEKISMIISYYRLVQKI